MELTITRGRGYIGADKAKTDDMPIGVIAVDAIYTPVDRVNMVVENTRVGQVTDFDILICLDVSCCYNTRSLTLDICGLWLIVCAGIFDSKAFQIHDDF